MSTFHFSISPTEIHRLNHKNFPKNISVTVNSSIFFFSFSQLLLFSPFLAQSTFESGQNLTLDLSDKFEIDQLLNYFSQLYSLLIDRDDIEISSHNVHIFRYFADLLMNIPLKKSCTRVFPNRSERFSLTFETLIFVPENIIQSLSYFTIDTDYESFRVNPHFMSCLSDSFYDIFTHDTSLLNHEFDISSEDLFYFSQILSILNGIELEYLTDDIQIFLRLSTSLNSVSLRNSVCQHLPESQSLSDHLQRISFYSPSYSFVFDSSIIFLAKHFGKISFENLLKIPLDALELIMGSDSLRIPSETELFETIIQLSLNDTVYGYLLKCVRFESVQSSALHHFFNNFGLEQLTSDIWEHLKMRLFSDVLIEKVDKDRYTSPVDAISESQMKAIIEKANLLSDETGHPYDKIMKIFSTLKGPKGEVLISKRNDSFHGIITKLREMFHSELNQYVYVSCSSTSSGNPNLLLEWNGNYWYSTNVPNSSFVVSFKNFSVTLSGYAIHSHSGTADFLINWKIEVSVDGNSWISVDHQENHKSIATSNGKEFFPVTTDVAARHIRLIQTGPGSTGTHHLLLGAIEFYGALTSLS